MIKTRMQYKNRGSYIVVQSRINITIDVYVGIPFDERASA